MSATDVVTRQPLIDSEEQAMIRATVAKVADRYVADGDSATVWRALTDAGFAQLRRPDEHGDPYGHPSDVLIVIEELARSLSDVPVISGLLAPELLRLGGLGAERIEELLGDEPIALVLDDDLDAVGAATAAGIAWDAGGARRALGIDGGDLFLVDLGDRIETGDLSRTARRPVGAVVSIGGRLDGTSHARFHQFASLAVAADTLGLTESLFALSLDYVKHRVQFGVPVGSFQAVQHICADSYVKLEALRSAILYASWAFEVERDDAGHAVDVAKAYANSAGVAIVNGATQAFGGIAITWEHRAHRTLRRALANREILGSDRVVLERLGRGQGG